MQVFFTLLIYLCVCLFHVLAYVCVVCVFVAFVYVVYVCCVFDVFVVYVYDYVVRHKFKA